MRSSLQASGSACRYGAQVICPQPTGNRPSLICFVPSARRILGTEIRSAARCTLPSPFSTVGERCDRQRLGRYRTRSERRCQVLTTFPPPTTALALICHQWQAALLRYSDGGGALSGRQRMEEQRGW